MAIYQVRLLKYLHGRGIADTAARKVWAFMGDDGPVRGNGKIVQEL
jgi:pyruvate dehydrogenase complex dehydrogenase (E1) component